MTDGSAPAMHLGELCQWDRQDQDLLVITDGIRRGHDALALPFRDATVVELVGDNQVRLDASFDAVVIDRESLSARWLATALPDLVLALRPNSPVVIVLDGSALHHKSEGSATTLDGFRWEGLETLNGKLCAVLRAVPEPGGRYSQAGELLAVASMAAALIRDHLPAPPDAEVGRLLEDRRRSEHALLARLDDLIAQLDQERRDHRGLRLVRTVLRRSRAGRAVLRTLRPLRSVASALRRRSRLTSTRNANSR